MYTSLDHSVTKSLGGGSGGGGGGAVVVAVSTKYSILEELSYPTYIGILYEPKKCTH
jgi:hypothetical protein